jgi:O-acetyl-ADP-ribose deacetylase (regulator of RNase III)
MSQSSLERLASYSLSKTITLNLLRGSVVDFSCPTNGAIVNAANEGCLGGGGVDGAISDAGGINLMEDRLALPMVSNGVRCLTGSAVSTGPGDYGILKVQYIIHAVGPRYYSYTNFETPDALLRSAYQKSLDVANEIGITEVAFSLLSAGVFRGERDLKIILEIAVRGIKDWVNENGDNCVKLESIYLVGFSAREANTLLAISRATFENETDSIGQIREEEEEEEDNEQERIKISDSRIYIQIKRDIAKEEENSIKGEMEFEDSEEREL